VYVTVWRSLRPARDNAKAAIDRCEIRFIEFAGDGLELQSGHEPVALRP
jgi:hypothetical protein